MNSHATPQRGRIIESAPKKVSSKITAKKVMDMPIIKNENVGVRRIENGFIVSKSGYVGKGKNQTYVNREYHSPVNPIKFGKSKK